MKVFLTLLFFTGIVILFLHYALHPPPCKVEYRYIPRNLEQKFRDGELVYESLKPMFDGTSVWLDPSEAQEPLEYQFNNDKRKETLSSLFKDGHTWGTQRSKFFVGTPVEQQ